MAERERIVIIDDSANDLQVTRRFLERNGYDVSVATSGEEGLTLAAKITPDATTIGKALKGKLSLSGLAAGFDAVFAPVLAGIRDRALTSDLPLIGPGIANAAQFLLDLKNNFDTALTNASGLVNDVMHRYGTNEHVAASLELFASVALLFYYILRIFSLSRND